MKQENIRQSLTPPVIPRCTPVSFKIDGRLSGAEVGLAEFLGEKLGKKK